MSIFVWSDEPPHQDGHYWTRHKIRNPGGPIGFVWSEPEICVLFDRNVDVRMLGDGRQWSQRIPEPPNASSE